MTLDLTRAFADVERAVPYLTAAHADAMISKLKKQLAVWRAIRDALGDDSADDDAEQPRMTYDERCERMVAFMSSQVHPLPCKDIARGARVQYQSAHAALNTSSLFERLDERPPRYRLATPSLQKAPDVL